MSPSKNMSIPVQASHPSRVSCHCPHQLHLIYIPQLRIKKKCIQFIKWFPQKQILKDSESRGLHTGLSEQPTCTLPPDKPTPRMDPSVIHEIPETYCSCSAVISKVILELFAFQRQTSEPSAAATILVLDQLSV